MHVHQKQIKRTRHVFRWSRRFGPPCANSLPCNRTRVTCFDGLACDGHTHYTPIFSINVFGKHWTFQWCMVDFFKRCGRSFGFSAKPVDFLKISTLKLLRKDILSPIGMNRNPRSFDWCTGLMYSRPVLNKQANQNRISERSSNGVYISMACHEGDAGQSFATTTSSFSTEIGKYNVVCSFFHPN